MGQQQSQNKDELLYQQVNYGNVEGIKALCQDGARLEWIDKEGKTPLIAACLNAELFHVAQTLIDLGANINAYRPGGHAGTPLHHAAKRGLEQTVKLLLSRGANPFLMNDDCHTPLDVARAKGYTNIVRTIEQQISPFYGWLRELRGPGFLEAFASQWLSKKIWAVVIPCAPRNPTKPLKLQLAIYATAQDAQPGSVISLWKAKIQEPKFGQSDPTVIILDEHTKTRYKFASENEGDKQQLLLFYNACFGISQVMPPLNATSPTIPPTAPPTTTEDVELAMAINASIHSSIVEQPPVPHGNPGSGVNSTNDWSSSSHNDSDSCGGPAPGSISSATQQSIPSVAPVSQEFSGTIGVASRPLIPGVANSEPSAVSQGIPETVALPSAPLIPDGGDYGPVHYPAIDSSPVELPLQYTEGGKEATSSDAKDGSASSSCVICLDAPIEGACIPCGHMAGCMSCLNEVKAKKWGCPVCRAKIQQVVRLYAV